jgi:hypothetical protein
VPPIWYLEVAYDLEYALHDDVFFERVGACNGFLRAASLTKDIRELTFEFLTKTDVQQARRTVKQLANELGVELLNNQLHSQPN